MFTTFAADVAVTMSDIYKVCIFIEINNKQTFWPSFTEMILFLVGQILNMVEIELKYGFP